MCNSKYRFDLHKTVSIASIYVTVARHKQPTIWNPRWPQESVGLDDIRSSGRRRSRGRYMLVRHSSGRLEPRRVRKSVKDFEFEQRLQHLCSEYREIWSPTVRTIPDIHARLWWDTRRSRWLAYFWTLCRKVPALRKVPVVLGTSWLETTRPLLTARPAITFQAVVYCIIVFWPVLNYTAWW